MHAGISGTIDFKEKDDPACIERLRSLAEKYGSPFTGTEKWTFFVRSSGEPDSAGIGECSESEESAVMCRDGLANVHLSGLEFLLYWRMYERVEEFVLNP